MVSLIGLVFFTLITSCGQEGGSEDKANGKSFSADMVVLLPNGEKMMESKIYVIPEATCMDWKQGASSLSSIRIEQENREYLFNHDKKVYYEMDLNEDEEVSNFLKSIQSIGESR